MTKTITVEDETRIAHTKYIEWLNRMINDYVSSFYDEAIKNIIELAFIRKNNSMLMELYQAEGKEMSAFLTILPSDTTDTLLMIHDLGSGAPEYYNSTDGANLFEFDTDGYLVKFYENITADLKNASGTVVAECFIIFEDLFGIKCPMFYVREKGSGKLMGKGLLDLEYEGRYSGSYIVENTPLDAVSYFEVTNLSKVLVSLDVPLLKDLNVKYDLAPRKMVKIPSTEWSTYYMKQLKEMNNLRIKKVSVS